MAFVEAKDKMVQITYTFLFSRKDNIWNHVYEFEHDISVFFKQKGLTAEPIALVEGSTGGRMIYIRDNSKEMELKNDKDVNKTQQFPEKKPEKSFQTVKKLVSGLNKSYKGK